MSKDHGARKHSKFSASGAERWTECPGSVELSEGRPDKSSIYSIEGTTAHEVLEHVTEKALKQNKMPSRLGTEFDWKWEGPPNQEMIRHAVATAEFLLRRHQEIEGADLLLETRVHLDFIHPEMFGTFDAAIVEHFGTLDVFDYKYGKGHAVSPTKNLQMIFYGIGLASLYNWNFKRVRLWVIQPRIKGYDGPTYWEIPIFELKNFYVDFFRKAVKRVENEPDVFVEGGHCKWCKAYSKCPLKQKARNAKARQIFNF